MCRGDGYKWKDRLKPPVTLSPAPPRWPWRLGQIAQGLIMGVLLWMSVVGLLKLAVGVPIFVYQGY